MSSIAPISFLMAVEVSTLTFSGARLNGAQRMRMIRVFWAVTKKFRASWREGDR
ncbi:hypothetical protein D3C79_1103820 [compost metagenome]